MSLKNQSTQGVKNWFCVKTCDIDTRKVPFFTLVCDAQDFTLSGWLEAKI